MLQKILHNITSDVSAQQYALTRIEDILSGTDGEATTIGTASQHAKLFLTENRSVDPTPFLQIMRQGDPYCQRAASTSLARLLIVSTGHGNTRRIRPARPRSRLRE